ncbi:MAG: D-alanyl-D-alanine carboxypeptidase [Aliarcobacter sp.]|jgi:D-alanyl-D-alanine carboxypeptidase (penicillin-binding protein 5/6)|nr:D-alanyl-D-alanine carboxypeptidase [Aliarcobacter sp.]MBP6713143.1 D-alanyl-D-alanine carboxypeptidase [Aliarcobacter sp.]MBP7225292.1 D-alanyl-D-alanine carboxypeptidase [Aliarcobacter sp.]MDX9960783.1 serine hydrolase [Aliarcobacter sp.]
MKILLVILFFILPSFALTDDSKVFKKMEKDFGSIIVKDLTKKKLIFSKDENQILRPASLTKIMTSMLAIESGKMNSVVTITAEMKKVEPTIANFKVGEKFYLKDLVHAAMIKSANDAANAIAIYLGNGNKQKFVSMMNYKAKKLGMMNTNFTNPCGFDIGNHSTTANDLLKLTEYAIKNKTFNSIVKIEKYAFSAINTKSRYVVHSSNKLLANEPYIVGVKTGYTNQAGACLIARAKKENKDVLMVMLNANNRWPNAKIALHTVMK